MTLTHKTLIIIQLIVSNHKCQCYVSVEYAKTHDSYSFLKEFEEYHWLSLKFKHRTPYNNKKKKKGK